MQRHDSQTKSRRELLRIDDGDREIARPGLIASEPGRAPQNEKFGSVMARYLERRTFLKGAAALVPAIAASRALLATSEAKANLGSTLTFEPLSPSTADQVIVPEDYDANVLICWGDPLFRNAPEFDPYNQTATAQRLQFGYNCDFIGYFPLGDKHDDDDDHHDHDKHDEKKRALLCVNHEYTTGGDMIPGYVAGSSKQIADIELAAHGGSVVEIVLKKEGWKYKTNSRYNRRITGETPIAITGPAAGHRLMRTSADTRGRTVLGMLNNCSGGKTPWGTSLTCEENFNQYFANNSLVADADIKAAHTRYGLTSEASSRLWEKFYDRFDLAKEPNEPFRFGWVVEIDPYNPDFQPRKHTALGRLKHEAATVVVSKSGHAVVYTGDDQQFDYVYKFVSRGRVNERRDEANHDILEHGTLYVAKFYDDGTGEWLPLTISNPTLAGQFSSQGEILIKTRLAADALGATAMDRPEDIETNPVSGKVYVVLTNNTARTEARADEANPRAPNPNGHILEIEEHQADHAATIFRWDVFILCGDPMKELLTDPAAIVPPLASNATYFAGYGDAAKLGKVAAPDNIAFDRRGNLWIATDGQPSNADIGQPDDAIHAVPTAGPERGFLRQFLSGPKGAELCGPEFDEGDRTLFCSIQHPGEDGGIPDETSTWPDGDPIPRPSVVTVLHRDGARIGK